MACRHSEVRAPDSNLEKTFAASLTMNGMLKYERLSNAKHAAQQSVREVRFDGVSYTPTVNRSHIEIL